MSPHRLGLLGVLLAVSLGVFSQVRAGGGSPTPGLAPAPAARPEDGDAAALLREAAALEATDAERSQDKARQALALARRHGDRAQQVKILYQLGHTLSTRGASTEAMSTAQEGLALAESLKDERQRGEFHRLISRLHWINGDLPGTATSAMESLRIAQTINDKAMQQRAEEMLGIVYATQDENDLARQHLEAAMRLGRETRSDDLALELDNLASLEQRQKDYPQARAHFQDALALIRQADPLHVLPHVLCGLGEIALAEGDGAAAARYLKESLPLAEQANQGINVANAQRNLAALARQQGRLDEARTSLEQSLATAQKFQAADLLSEIYNEFIQQAKARADYREAFEYAGKLAEQTELIRGEKTQRKVSEVQHRYETQVHAREIELLQRDKDLQQAELALRKTELSRAATQRYALLAVMLCAGVAVAALISRQRAHARITQQDLAETRLAKAEVEQADARKAQLLTAAARELQESEARFRGAFEFSALGMALARPDGQWLRVNEALCKILGYDQAELVGTSAFSLTDPADREENQLLLDRLLRGEIDTFQLEKRYRHRDGRTVWTLVAASLVRDPARNQPLYLIAQVQDITQRRQADETLRLAKTEAERANAAKSEFLSRISHELRTPLNAILGFGQLLEIGAVDDQQRDCTRHILQAGRHLLELVNEVLDITRIESGQLSFVREPVPVEELIEGALEIVRPLAVEARVSLRVERQDLGRARVHGDAQRLRQVLLNLLSNAIKYNHPEGSVSVSCREAGPERLRVEISDTGPGIAAGDLESIFAPFTRLAATQAIRGTGLGLSLSRGLVQAMGGTLGVRSEPGSGSVFWVELASSEGPVDEMAAMFPPIPVPSTGQEPKTILYIEDNPANSRLVECLTEDRTEWRLLAADQGRRGLEMARQHRPSLVLLDLHLPDLHGVDVLRALRRQPECRDTPVIIITADGSGAASAVLGELGVCARLTKPFAAQDLYRAIEMAMA